MCVCLWSCAVHSLAVLGPACVSFKHYFHNAYWVPCEHRPLFKCFASIDVVSSVKSPKIVLFSHPHFSSKENEVGWGPSISWLKSHGFWATELVWELGWSGSWWLNHPTVSLMFNLLFSWCPSLSTVSPRAGAMASHLFCISSVQTCLASLRVQSCSALFIVQCSFPNELSSSPSPPCISPHKRPSLVVPSHNMPTPCTGFEKATWVHLRCPERIAFHSALLW